MITCIVKNFTGVKINKSACVQSLTSAGNKHPIISNNIPNSEKYQQKVGVNQILLK